MQTFKNKLIALAAVGILAVIGSLMNQRAGAQRDPGAPVSVVSPLPLPVTVGNSLAPSKPSDLITAGSFTFSSFTGGCPSAGKDFLIVDNVVSPNGTVAAHALTIPAGQVLVITEVELAEDASNLASRNVQVTLGVPNCGSQCLTPLVKANVATDSSGRGSTHLSLSPGIPVRAGTTLCVGEGLFGEPDAAVHGYFTKDQ